MKNTNKPSFSSEFEEEVWKGLNDFPKHLPSRFIYDEKGDKLFQDIMNMPEYYLTDSEFAILEKHKKGIAEYFASKQGFDLIELGAGDGKKTKILLRYLYQKNYNFDYFPIDISQHILDSLEKSLHEEIPGITVKPQQGSYFEILEELIKYNKRKKVILLLGSNIGNLLHKKAIKFLEHIRKAMGPEDMLFLGFDQKKNPETILKAYNDEAGITEAFNKNILHRINRELDGDFDTDKFIHWETYNPESGTAKSFLVSKANQNVEIPKLNMTVGFKAWESIHVEISQKYDDKVVGWLAEEAGLKIIETFTDNDDYFKNYVFQRSL